MALKIDIIVSKGLKLEARELLEVTPTFEKLQEKNCKGHLLLITSNIEVQWGELITYQSFQKHTWFRITYIL